MKRASQRVLAGNVSPLATPPPTPRGGGGGGGGAGDRAGRLRHRRSRRSSQRRHGGPFRGGGGCAAAGEASRHRTPTPFVWIHSAELRHHVLQISDRLGGQIHAAEVKRNVPSVQELTDRVAQALGLLHAQPSDPGVALAVRHTLLSASDATETLTEELG